MVWWLRSVPRGLLYRPATVMIGERFGESTLRQYHFFSKTYPNVRQNSETSENLGEIMLHKAFFYGNFPSMTIEESKLNEITNILIVKPMNQVWRSAWIYPEVGENAWKMTKTDPDVGTHSWKTYPPPRHMTHINIGEYPPRVATGGQHWPMVAPTG